MSTRREFIETGLSAVLLGLLHRSGFASPRPMFRPPPPLPPNNPLGASQPFFALPNHPPSVMVGDLPFAADFLGDDFSFDAIPFHSSELNGKPPAPTESVELAIVGGGLSGLTTAYLLRDRLPVLFELHPRFGGVSQGETWAGTHYSMGGAYFIAPDKDTWLESLYIELGLDRAHRLSEGGDDPVELGGKILEDFWSTAGNSPQDLLAFQKYQQIVKYYMENYPDIPLDPKADNDWILELDAKSLRHDIEERMGMPIPKLLAAAIQGYCYSSFDASWDEISAAAGWNFVAAEEFGRWVCPGGNAFVADALWKRLVAHYQQAPGSQLDRIRPATRVVDVRMADSNRKVLVTFKNSAGAYRSLLADRVVMACSKHVCKYLLHDLADADPARLNAMNQVMTVSYVVANVLLKTHDPLEHYDVFLLHDGNFPMDSVALSANSQVVDMLNGSYAQHGHQNRSVLTLYWPLPWGEGPFTLVVENAWQDYANRLVPQIHTMLELLKVPVSKVEQVRMTRWGHAMPIANIGFLAKGNPEMLRAPYLDRVYFANQDNWALPAFETSLLEAKYVADLIRAK